MLKMSFSLALATLLCLTKWMGKVHATHGPSGECLCPSWSTTRIKLNKIVNYTIQYEGICPIKALMVHTIGGKMICSKPNTDWAKRVIRKVDKDMEELQEKLQNEAELSGDITPTAPTTSKKKEKSQKKGTNGQRRQKKRSRRGKKQLRKRIQRIRRQSYSLSS